MESCFWGLCANLERCPAGPTLNPPQHFPKLGKVLRSPLACCQQNQWKLGIQIWLHRRRKNLGLEDVGGVHPTVRQEINPGGQMSLNSAFHRIPVDVSSL
jgi:hypothetical protein